jgi:type IV pilus assembly protein PilO
MDSFSDIGNRWAQLSEGQKTLLQAIGMVLLLAALFYLGLSPLWKESKALQRDIDGEKIKLDRIIRTQAQITRFKQDLAEMDAKYKQIQAMLPEEKEIPALLKTISDLGQQQQLDFLLFKPEKEIPRDFVSEIPVTINFKGQYHQIGVFFDLLRRLPRIVNAKQLELGSFNEKTGLINARCQLVTFRVLPLSPPPPAPSPKVGKKK